MLGTKESRDHVSVRVPPDLKQALYKAAKARFEQPSDYLRRALVSALAAEGYLGPETKKVLGVTP